MGTCLGRCLHKNSGSIRHRLTNGHTLVQDESIEFFNLVDVSEEIERKPKRSAPSIVSKLFSKMDKRKNKTKRKPVLELAEDIWCPLGDTNYRKLNNSSSLPNKFSASNSGDDISLQCLDARSLLTRGAGKEYSIISSSTPPSSLDLEWENEGLPSPAPWQIVPEEDDFLNFESSSQNSQTTNNAQQPKCSSNATNLSGWSHISTPDSLEWDPVQTSLQNINDLAVNELDAETEQLLSEIERLTKTALKETGRELDIDR